MNSLFLRGVLLVSFLSLCVIPFSIAEKEANPEIKVVGSIGSTNVSDGTIVPHLHKATSYDDGLISVEITKLNIKALIYSNTSLSILEYAKLEDQIQLSLFQTSSTINKIGTIDYTIPKGLPLVLYVVTAKGTISVVGTQLYISQDKDTTLIGTREGLTASIYGNTPFKLPSKNFIVVDSFKSKYDISKVPTNSTTPKFIRISDTDYLVKTPKYSYIQYHSGFYKSLRLKPGESFNVVNSVGELKSWKTPQLY